MPKTRKSAWGAKMAVAAFTAAASIATFAAPAFANEISFYNWYGSNFSFDTTLTGSTRYYDLDNIGCDFYSYADGEGAQSTFKLTLYRKNIIGATPVETKIMKRTGDNKADWYGVGAGDYFFYFSKTYDGVTVKSDAMGMYSWD